ncbi:MAG: D-alanine--D-alanine ligase [Candidatus Bipolaricaulota bacterium]|nr:D-alanine--D-alanine ligase [Candidatus Bipolaricaulota bacterium]
MLDQRKARPRITVLAGGDSPERDVSLISGETACKALLGRGHNAKLLVIESLDDLVPGLAGTDVAFLCLHGGAGEDGTVQLLLEILGIPYTGPGPLACHRAMDKLVARRCFAQHRIPIPMGFPIDAETSDRGVEQAIAGLMFPVVVKPVNLGSSVGVRVVRSADELREMVPGHAAKFGSLLVEELIPGREFTIGVLEVDGEPIPLPVVEVIHESPVFDHDAKETKVGCTFDCPAKIPATLAKQAHALALRAHKALGCSGYSRIDMRLDAEGKLRVLELNALPGMTPGSDLPRGAAAGGYDYPALVEAMLATARCGTDRASGDVEVTGEEEDGK